MQLLGGNNTGIISKLIRFMVLTIGIILLATVGLLFIPFIIGYVALKKMRNEPLFDVNKFVNNIFTSPNTTGPKGQNNEKEKGKPETIDVEFTDKNKEL